MKHQNRFLALLLCFSMLLSQIPGAAFADNSAADTRSNTTVTTDADTSAVSETTENVCGDGLTWSIEDHTLTISYTGEGSGAMTNYTYSETAPWSNLYFTTVVIGEGVTSIGNCAFRGTVLTSVSISDTVTSIGHYALENTGLTSISIPSSVTSIGSGVFSSCKNLKSISLSEGLKTFGSSVFYDTGLTSITIPASVSSMDISVFGGCSSLETVVFQEDSALTTLAASMFSCCTNLRSVILPDNLSVIDSFAFSETGLTSITIPSSVSIVGQSAFNCCPDLKDVTFPADSKVSALPESAFYQCSKLESITLPDGLTSIGNNAFYECTALKGITIPAYVDTIGGNAFYKCTGLTSLVFAKRNLDNHDYAPATKFGSNAFAFCTSLKSVALPAAEFDSFVFNSCTSLETVTTNGLATTSLGFGLFCDCTALSSVSIAPSVTTINSYAFSQCTSLKTITIPPNVTTIQSFAFSGTGLKTVYYGGTNWDGITIGSDNAPLTDAVFRLCEGNNWYLTKDYELVITAGVFTGETEGVDDFGDKRSWVKSIEIKDAVTDISPGAFHNYPNLTMDDTNLVISSSHPHLTAYGGVYILSGDGTRLITLMATATNPQIPATVTQIDDYAFYPFYSYNNNNDITFLGDAPTLSDKALSGCTPAGLDIHIDPSTKGWSYPKWNGMSVNCDAVIDTVSLDAKDLTGGTVTLTATTKLNVPGHITLYYSLDQKKWSSFAEEYGTSKCSKSFEPSDLNIPSDAEYVWFSAGIGDQSITEVTTIKIPVSISVPATVTGLTLKSVDMNLVTLAWNMIPDDDHELFSHFLVERKTGDGEYKQIRTIYPDSNGALTCGINDTSVSAGTLYTYRVSAVYSNGYAGQAAEIKVSTKADTVNPALTGLTPKSSRYNTNFTVTATATDNDGLSSIRFSYSIDAGKTWTDLDVKTVSGTSASASANVDITNLPDGELRIRAIAVDRTGNTSAEYTVGYILDRVAPAAPVLNEVTDKTTTVLSITWTIPADKDVARFYLYRSLDGESWSSVANVTSNGYTNTGLSTNTTYYYKVTAVDTTGNESEASAVLTASTAADTTAPKNVTVSPASGYTFGPSQTIQAHAYDETALKSLTLYYRAQGTEQWQVFKTLETSETSEDLKVTLAGLPSGTYELYASAIDSAGNQSEHSATVTYTLDCDAPVVSSVTTVAGTEQVTITWTTPNESDLAGFYIYRGNSLAGSVTNQGKSSYTFTDKLPWNMCQGASYTYKVAAIDSCGNRSETSAPSAVTPTATTDTTDPVAYVNMVDTTFAGDSNYFSSAGSYDDRGIASYAWDMGDGTTYSKASFSHAYTVGGTYTVTLTITDTSGNTATVSDTISVIADDEYTTPKITVVGYETDTPNETFPLKGAQVVFDLGGENISYYTNSNGTTQFRRLEEGTFHIGAYMDGYLPASADITLVHGQPVEATLKLEKKPIVTGTLTTRELTYQEIVDLGINVNDPDNQNVYHFSASINIGGNITKYNYYYNDNGEEVGSGGGSQVKVTRVGNSSYTIKPNVAKATRPSSGGSSGSNVGREEVTIPYVTVLEVPGTVSVLKQFYEAELTVINQANAEFFFDDSRATLNIPNGLTLIPTETTAVSATTPMTQPGQKTGVIQGQGSASTKWILRGDAPGEYDLSATFNATLRDFDAPIQAEFKAEDSIVVRDPKDIHLDMYISNTMLDRTFFLDLELYSDSGTLNLPQIKLGKYHPAEIAIREEDGFERAVTGTVTELKEGETLIYKYKITLDKSVPLLFESNILKGELESGDMTVNRYVRNITKFDLFKGDFDLTELGVFIKTLPSMPPSQATQFWQFIHNTSTMPPDDDMCYRILSGSLADYDGTLEELRFHILSMFEVVRARINTYVKDSDDCVGFLTTELTNALWDCIDVDPNDDTWTNARSGAMEELFEGMVEWYSELDGISNDALLSLQGIAISADGLNETWETMENIIKGMRVAVSSIGLVFNSEYSGRYAYFNYYLNNRLDYETPSDSVFQALLSSAVNTLTQKYWTSELLDTFSWITGEDSWNNHTDTIEKWAEILYQFEVVALYYDNAGTPSDERLQLVDINYRTSDATYDPTNMTETFPYNWSWFEKSSRTYNQKLAALTLGMVMAGSSTPQTDNRYKETISLGEGDRAQNIRQAYKDLNFTADQYYNYDDPLDRAEDKVAFSIAHRTLNSGTPLVAVFLRGGQYGAEWSSNFNVGSVGDHKGFDTAAAEVATALGLYLTEHNLSNVKVWMGGYSRSAATANIAAHRMLDQKLVQQDDLFVYTFATPSGYYLENSSNSGTSVEANIFNIISAHDVVPKVALADWGFSKYGRTLVLPTDVSEIADVYYLMTKANLGVTTETRYLSEKAEEILSKLVTNRGLFVTHLQEPITKNLAVTFANDGGKFDVSEVLSAALDVAKKEDISVAKLLLSELFQGTVSQIRKEGKNIMKAHYMEYYLAWLRYGPLAQPSDYEKRYIARSICAECPVDIEVYNSGNQLVAHIKDNQVLVDKIPAAVVGDAKVVYLYDQDYRVVLTGNDTGSMTYTIREYDADKVVRELRYYDVPLTDGCQYTQNIVASNAVSLTTITAQDQSTISVDEDSKSTSAPNKYLIGVVNGTCELTAAAPGTTVTAAAEATLDGKPFAYWTYQSDDAAFILTQAAQQTVTFTMPKGAVRLEAVYGNSIAIEGGNVTVDGTTATVTADADSNGMTFLRWEVLAPTEGLGKLDLTNSPLTFQLPNAPVSLRAVYTPVDTENFGTPATYDSYAIIHNPTANGSTVEANLSYLLKDGITPTVICAFYDADGHMVDSSFQVLTFGTQTVSFQTTLEFTTARLYILDSKETIRPLCPAKTVP